MSGDTWRPRLSEYLDGELTAEERAALEAHLERCPACQDDLAGLQRVVQRIDSAPDLRPPRDLWPAIARRREARMEGGRPAAWRLAAALAAVGTMAFAAWMWQERGRTEGRVTEEAAGRYGAAAAQWQEVLDDRSLPADLAAALEAEMATMERAVRETRQALARNPDDADLRAHLSATLRAQARFLARIGDMAGEES